jgi:hypothetical protein
MQEAPTPLPIETRVQVLVDVFEEVARRAEAGNWQSADAAYNDAVAALDALGPGLVLELGEPAVAAIAALETQLPDMVASLDAEDAAAVRASAALIRTALRPLAPRTIPQGPPPSAAAAVLSWRRDLAAALAAGAEGRWLDMRDQSTDLAAALQRGTQTVVSAGGPETALELQRALVFVRRVRAAALDRAIEEGLAAGALAESALGSTLRLLTETETTEETATPIAGASFAPMDTEAVPGGIVVVPIVAEDLPDVMLGSFVLRVSWSSGALRLRDVEWATGQGAVDSASGTGSVILTLPHAPTGPSGTAPIAFLEFEVLGADVSARDYLPEGHADMEARVAAAREMFARADLPIAGREVMAAYFDFVAGADESGSLWHELDRRGLREGLESALLELLDALTLPAEPDVILERFEHFESLSSATAAGFAAPLADSGEVPVVVNVVEARDTRGELIPIAPGAPGTVRIIGAPAAGRGPGVDTARGPGPTGLSAGASAVTSSLVVTAPQQAAPDPAPADAAGRPGIDIPGPLILALGLAALAGGGAMWWTRERDATPE